MLLVPLIASALPQPDVLMNNTFYFWNTYRDPWNGLFCDGVLFEKTEVCGETTNRRYSSASVGMGLVADCAFVEMGLLKRDEARKRSLQTLDSLVQWPVESFSGFFVHWTCADNDHKLNACGEYSTVDTAEMVMGALFAGNYFGGDVQKKALELAKSISWNRAIKAADDPTIFPTVNHNTGEMTGSIRPFNEYYIVAYVAQLLEGKVLDGKARKYFDTYFGQSGPPKGRDGYPVHLAYDGIDLLTDNNARFMSSFIPQFCWFLTKGFHTNEYYEKTLFPNWRDADMKFWRDILGLNVTVWGQRVDGRLWGSGAGQSPTGYSVDRIGEQLGGRDRAVVASPAIMAGFLGAGARDAPERALIMGQLQWLFEQKVCTYEKPIDAALTVRVLWRCAVEDEKWRAARADSIDYSTMVLGYAVSFLPDGFYAKFAV